MFAAASASFVRAACSGALLPVSSLDAADDLAPLQLVVKQRRKWAWQKPKYQPTSFSLADILTTSSWVDGGMLWSQPPSVILREPPNASEPPEKNSFEASKSRPFNIITDHVSPECSSEENSHPFDSSGEKSTDTNPHVSDFLSADPKPHSIEASTDDLNNAEPHPQPSKSEVESHPFDSNSSHDSKPHPFDPNSSHDPEHHPFDSNSSHDSKPHPFDPNSNHDPQPSDSKPGVDAISESRLDPVPNLSDPNLDINPEPRSLTAEGLSLGIPTTVSDFLSFEHSSTFSAGGEFGLSIVEELVGVKVTADAKICVDAKFGRIDKRQIRVDDLHDALKGRKVNMNNDLVEDTKRHKSTRHLCVVTTTVTTATSSATIETRREKEFHGNAVIGIPEAGLDIESRLDLDKKLNGRMDLPKGTAVAFGVAELKIFSDGGVKMALLDGQFGGFFDQTETETELEEGDDGVDLCCVEDVQAFVDLDAASMEALRGVVFQLARKPVVVDVLISVFKSAHYAMASVDGASLEAKISISEDLKQLINAGQTENLTLWRKFLVLSGFSLVSPEEPISSGEVGEMTIPRERTAFFEPTWTLLQAMAELSDEQLQQLDQIEDRMAGPLIFMIRKLLVNQCVEKTEEKAFRLFAKNDRKDKDNNNNKCAKIIKTLGVKLVRREMECGDDKGDGGDGGSGNGRGDGADGRHSDEGGIVRFDPPSSWKEKLELASALKVIYAIFAGEKRVQNFLGTERKSPFLCCIG